MTTQFAEDIERFNTMYGLPMPAAPLIKHIDVAARMQQFKVILSKEVEEVDDIIKAAEAGASDLDLAVMLADWLGDITVYAASEARKFGLPMEGILKIIMQSNFSKLAADGSVIMKDGKVHKGPNYWKPEPKLKEMLQNGPNDFRPDTSA